MQNELEYEEDQVMSRPSTVFKLRVRFTFSHFHVSVYGKEAGKITYALLGQLTLRPDEYDDFINRLQPDEIEVESMAVRPC